MHGSLCHFSTIDRELWPSKKKKESTAKPGGVGVEGIEICGVMKGFTKNPKLSRRQVRSHGNLTNLR